MDIDLWHWRLMYSDRELTYFLERELGLAAPDDKQLRFYREFIGKLLFHPCEPAP